MNSLDSLIIIILLAQALIWARNGLVLSLLSLGGFWVGLVLGALIAPELVGLFGLDVGGRFLLSLAIILGCAIGLQSLGQLAGQRLHGLAERLKLGSLNSVLGAAVGSVMSLLIIWLLASVINGTPLRALNAAIHQSAILQTLNERLPPAPDVLSRLGSLIRPGDFPQVFNGLEPRPSAPVAPPAGSELAAALAAAGPSTVKLEGLGCGGTVTGSGFVAGPGLVVTNAHVVAGIDRPVIIDQAGRRPAVPVVFDPALDIAVLRADNLAGRPLALNQALADRGTTGAIIGYPAGGPLDVEPAAILRQLSARGRNIYGTAQAERAIYEVQATVIEGNSGGPLVNPAGEVLGVVFARSVGVDGVGYVVRASEVAPLLAQAQASRTPVDTAGCSGQRY